MKQITGMQAISGITMYVCDTTLYHCPQMLDVMFQLDLSCGTASAISARVTSTTRSRASVTRNSVLTARRSATLQASASTSLTQVTAAAHPARLAPTARQVSPARHVFLLNSCVYDMGARSSNHALKLIANKTDSVTFHISGSLRLSACYFNI